MIDFKGNPFFLSDEDITWVEQTLASLTLEQKLGQIFCPVGFTTDEAALKHLAEDLGIGGIMYRPGPGVNVQHSHQLLQQSAKIPMLLAANLESGGTGLASDGTPYGMPLQAAAADCEDAGYKLGKVSCAEGAAVGCNWAFAPIVDIDRNFRNPITNLRTFGNDPDKIIAMAKGYLRAADEEGLAVSIKHFPGDGCDERDQHLLTSVNDLSCEEWDDSYGKIYSTLIAAGAKTVMVGHIAQPAYVHRFNPGIPAHNITPATLSPEIIGGLLRGKLSFNGVISTDATPMNGFCVGMKRSDAVPYSIAIGCDVFLFNKSLEEDFGYMLEGCRNGVLSQARVDEAVSRILALKASLKLHIKQREGRLVPGPEALSILRNPTHLAWEKECADRSVTLVKDTAHNLPLSPAKTKRVLLNVIEESDSPDTPTRILWKGLLEKEGFAVTVRNRDVSISLTSLTSGEPDARTAEIIGEAFGSVDSFCKQYDLVLYVANMATASNTTVIRIGWKGFGGMGNDAPWFVKELPVVFVSVANPYHLLDVPMINTFVNAYSGTEEVAKATVEKLMGRSEFVGNSPVDPFCGRWDTAL